MQHPKARPNTQRERRMVALRPPPSFRSCLPDAETTSMKQQLKNLIERVLIARPDASPDDIRNLVPALRERTDEEIERLVAPTRDRRAKNSR